MLQHTGELDVSVLVWCLRVEAVIEGVFVVGGVVCNIFNIVVFKRIGYLDTSNILLTALSVSDIGALVSLYLTIIIPSTWFDLNFDPVDFGTVFLVYPHHYFVRTSGLITAFAACERCLCVVMPLKVKQIITKKVTLTYITVTCVVMTLYMFPINYVTHVEWYVAANQTYFRINFHPNVLQVFGVSYFITDLFVPYLTYTVLIVCTVVISVKIRQSVLWRQTVSTRAVDSRAAAQEVPMREKRLIKMITFVAVFFVLCQTPLSLYLTATALIPSTYVTGKYYDIGVVCYLVIHATDNLSCTINTFVYYKMSHKFRRTFQKIFLNKFCRHDVNKHQ